MRRKKRQSVPTEYMDASILNLSHDGRGIARIDGKTTFIGGALPNERVRFKYTRSKADFDEGETVEVLEPSPMRVIPKCPHFEMCGGCSMQHVLDAYQIETKQAQLLDLLRRFAHIEPETRLPPLTAKSWHYRNKARLSVRYVEKKGTVLVGFREKNNGRYITHIQQCPILHEKVDASIVTLCEMLHTFSSLHAIAQIELSAGDEDVALIFRNLEPLSEGDLQKLEAFGASSGFLIYLQPGGEDSVHLFYPQHHSGYLSYQHPEHRIHFNFYPTDFTQVNAPLNRLMVTKALSLLDLQPEEVLLDLFCGLGNFSLPAARYCKKVIGVEGSEKMVLRAKANAAHNGLDNTQFFAANLEEPNHLIRIIHQPIDKLLLDPPRSGALEIVQNIDKLNPKRIVYVSCNPATLARDTACLVNEKGYRLMAAGVMDMFPQTAHVESIALFQRK